MKQPERLTSRKIVTENNMKMKEELKFLPCFYLHHNDRKIPYLCSFVFINNGVEVLPPITKDSINEMVEITKKEGLLITKIFKSGDIAINVNKSLEKMKRLEYEANILFLFPDQDIAEEFFLYIQNNFKLELIKRA